MLNFSPNLQVPSFLPPFHIFNSLPQEWETWLPLPTKYYSFAYTYTEYSFKMTNKYHYKTSLLGQEIHKMSLEHLVVPENKKGSKTNKNHNDRGMSKGNRGANCRSSQWTRLEQSEQQDIVVLDNNSKHKIDIHEAMLIK